MDAQQSSVARTIPPVPDSVKEQAEYYCTNERNIVRYRAKAAPLKDPHKFREWILKQSSAPQGLIYRLDDLLGSDAAYIPGQSDPDWDEFEKSLLGEDPKQGMERLEKACAWVSFKFEKATQASDRDSEKHYANLIAKLEAVKHDAQLRAKKLGIDNAELIKRDEVERVLSVMGVWLIRGVNDSLRHLTPAFATAQATGQLNRDTIKRLLDDEFLTDRVRVPLQRAVSEASAVGLPQWAADAIFRGMDDVLEPEQKTA